MALSFQATLSCQDNSKRTLVYVLGASEEIKHATVTETEGKKKKKTQDPDQTKNALKFEKSIQGGIALSDLRKVYY